MSMSWLARSRRIWEIRGWPPSPHPGLRLRHCHARSISVLPITCKNTYTHPWIQQLHGHGRLRILRVMLSSRPTYAKSLTMLRGFGRYSNHWIRMTFQRLQWLNDNQKRRHDRADDQGVGTVPFHGAEPSHPQERFGSMLRSCAVPVTEKHRGNQQRR